MSHSALPALVPRVRFRTKREFVYRALRDAIMRCELEPGRRLVIDELAQKLEVSSIPVREGLQLLQSEGLVTNIPHVGATVSLISRESVDEVFTVMEGLEIVASRSAAQRMTREEADTLEGVVVAMDTALREGKHHEWADLNTRFHLEISRLAAMPMLLEAQTEHRSLLRAMREKDLPALEETVKHHNRGALLAYAEYQRGHPE